MPPHELSRRAFVGTAGLAGAGLAAAWLGATPADLLAASRHAVRSAASVRDGTPPAFQVLSPAEAADVEAFAAQIIPTDDTPGAREAGVVYFLDRALATFAAGQRAAVTKGLADLTALVGKRHPGARSFSGLTFAQQTAIVQVVEKEQPEFFNAMRFGTVAGMFASPDHGGNRGKVGWKLIGFEDRFSWSPPFGYYDRDENRRG
jgi:gluconate 2-dehydrogenase gamma chain